MKLTNWEVRMLRRIFRSGYLMTPFAPTHEIKAIRLFKSMGLVRMASRGELLAPRCEITPAGRRRLLLEALRKGA